jgi:L-ornithine N5-oxygenase
VPDVFTPFLGEGVFHSSAFTTRIGACRPGPRPTIAVIGSGQNAAEILVHLHGAWPESRLVSVHRSIGFRQLDLGHFSNEIFHPEEVDYFFALSPAQRRAALADARYTNYGAVDEEVADVLYRKMYEDEVLGRPRIEMIKRAAVRGVAETAGGYRLTLEDVNTGRPRLVDADLIVLGTGFDEERVPALLSPLEDLLRLDADGLPAVSHDYRLVTDERCRVPLYLSGLTERSHGMSNATSFSMMALKAQRIAEALAAHALAGADTTEDHHDADHPVRPRR